MLLHLHSLLRYFDLSNSFYSLKKALIFWLILLILQFEYQLIVVINLFTDTTMHSDGPDTVPAMQVMVWAVAPFLKWLGPLLNMLKSVISRHWSHSSDEQYHVQQHTVHGPSPRRSTQGSGSIIRVFMTSGEHGWKFATTHPIDCA
jgi:hypothetical protein